MIKKTKLDLLDSTWFTLTTSMRIGQWAYPKTLRQPWNSALMISLLELHIEICTTLYWKDSTTDLLDLANFMLTNSMIMFLDPLTAFKPLRMTFLSKNTH